MSVEDMKQQRDQALACMYLAISISLAVFLSVYGKGERVALENAKALLLVNQQLQSSVSKALQNNQRAFVEARATLDHLEHPAN